MVTTTLNKIIVQRPTITTKFRKNYVAKSHFLNPVGGMTGSGCWFGEFRRRSAENGNGMKTAKSEMRLIAKVGVVTFKARGQNAPPGMGDRAGYKGVAKQRCSPGA